MFSNFIRVILNNKRFENAGESENEWLQQTRTNLHLVFEKMLKNPDVHWKVKLAMISLVGGVVEDCSVTLEPSLPLLIKKLVQFTADECQDVEKAARERILTLSFSQAKFDSAIRQNMYDIVTCLPRIVTQGSMAQSKFCSTTPEIILYILYSHTRSVGDLTRTPGPSNFIGTSFGTEFNFQWSPPAPVQGIAHLSYTRTDQSYRTR